ncbi:hypothetical protein FPV67DRAFT_1043812 [Lyophyllum atratum]|nr:hypothetical protein FPV67DRAFT_1043812 [Lyophyllum atratum]
MTNTTMQNTDAPPPASATAATPSSDASAAPAPNPFRDTNPSPPAASDTATTTAPPPSAQDQQQQRETPGDPRIAALRAMFPDYDDLILQSVLASVNGDQDRAIDALLGMSDPEYKGELTPETPVMSQTDLDEQLARRLMLEEQEQHQVAWQAQQDARRPLFQQQQPRPTSGQGQGQQGQGGDTMQEIQQQLGKFAETGKKTFGNLFSKVKAKIQEMDQPRPGQGSGTQPTWGGGSGGYDPARYEQYVYQGQQQQQPQPPYSTRPQQQPAYYDPNAQSSYPIHAAPSPSPPIALSGSNVQGYDVTPGPARTTSPPASTPAAAYTAATPPTSDTPRPPSTGSGRGTQSSAPPIDGGRLGLLPKRPVSLMRSQSPPGLQAQHSQQSQQDTDDSDGLEYAENPFDEPKPAAKAK